MSTPYNPGQNPNEPSGSDPHGQNPHGQNPYGTNAEGSNFRAHPEGVSGNGGYAGHEQLTPDYTRGDAGHAGYGMAGGNYNAAPTSYGFEPAPTQQQNNGVALAAMILGILALLGLVFVFPAIILGIIALVLGIVGVRKASSIQGPGARKGMAITGIVTSVIALILSVLMLIFGFSMAKQLMDDGVFEACEQFQNDNEKFQTCIEDEVEKSLNN
ncbi:DUF4190 domain-containing protein [Corynebacterium wankanglinii]|uniref:DUF4190 domain-containing protein n=1 Tax=Corynebacterium wankanglinii TaxID=2735136 RepID=A0A838CIJ3_9CORY|nr:DUF4190 domain-containing protein [Corynebacterium wankanglinii]MBA1834854.1 DUF4190 domain-containing protein [Corynebacterium wankanglinii]